MFLGRFAGDVALMFGARAGVYLAGGIVPSFVDFLKRSPLRGCFEDKGAFANYLRDIPIYVVTRPDPAFLGLAYLVDAD
jgi:glucokinase